MRTLSRNRFNGRFRQFGTDRDARTVPGRRQAMGGRSSHRAGRAGLPDGVWVTAHHAGEQERSRQAPVAKGRFGEHQPKQGGFGPLVGAAVASRHGIDPHSAGRSIRRSACVESIHSTPSVRHGTRKARRLPPARRRRPADSWHWGTQAAATPYTRLAAANSSRLRRSVTVKRRRTRWFLPLPEVSSALVGTASSDSRDLGRGRSSRHSRAAAVSTASADTSSTQVGGLITDLRLSSTFAQVPSPAKGRGGIMICRTAAPGLPRHDQLPGVPTPPADERQRKGHRDPRTPAPTAGPTASGRQADPHRQRPCHPRRPAPPPPQRQTAAPSAAGPPRHGVALASRPAQAAPCRNLRTQATRTPTHHPIDTRPGPAPGQGEHLMGVGSRLPCDCRAIGRVHTGSEGSPVGAG